MSTFFPDLQASRHDSCSAFICLLWQPTRMFATAQILQQNDVGGVFLHDGCVYKVAPWSARAEQEVWILETLNGSIGMPCFRGSNILDGLVTIKTDYMDGGDLCNFVLANGKMSPSQVLNSMRTVAEALQCMHLIGYAHLDVTLENIVCSADGSITKLIDFGLAQKNVPGPVVPRGKERYIPPEMFKIDLQTGTYMPSSADVFELGVCILTALCGAHPFLSAGQEDYTDAYLQWDNHLQKRGVPTPIIELTRQMCHPLWHSRPSIADVLILMANFLF